MASQRQSKLSKQLIINSPGRHLGHKEARDPILDDWWMCFGCLLDDVFMILGRQPSLDTVSYVAATLFDMMILATYRHICV